MKTKKPRSRSTAQNPIALAVAAALGTGAGLYPAVAGAGEPFTLLDAVIDHVNVTTPVLAIDADGDVFYAWTARDGDPDGDPVTDDATFTVKVARAGADGSRSEITTLAAARTDERQFTELAIATDADGDSVVAWITDDFDTGESTANARRVSADGTANGEAFAVSANGYDAYTTDVAMDAAGNFVVAWDNAAIGAIMFRRYTADGAPLTEVAQQASTAASSRMPRVSAGPDGHFAVAWTQAPYLVARPYSPAGVALADEVVVDEVGTPFPFPIAPELAVDADGDFAVGWVDYDKYTDPYGAKYSQHIVKAQRFGADGNAFGVPAELHDSGVAPWAAPVFVSAALTGAAFDTRGNALVGWRLGDITSGAVGSFTASVNAAGEKVSVDLPFEPGECAPDGEGDCLDPSVLAWDADGDVVVGYASFDTYEAIVTGYHAQRFEGAETTDLSATLGVSASALQPGDELTLTLTIENLHPLDDYYGVPELAGAIGATRDLQVSLVLPAALGFDGELAGWTCASADEGAVSCTHPGPLWSADEMTMETTLEIPADATGSYALSASVTSADTDSETGNNADEISITVSAAPDDSGDPPPANNGGGGGGGGALGWLAMLLAPLAMRRRLRDR